MDFKEQKRDYTFNTYAKISLITILIILLVYYFLMVDPTYSQENAASTTTTDSGPSQHETNMTIKLVVFLIFCYAGWTIYKTPTYVKEDTTRRQHYKCPICKRGTSIWDFDHKDGNRSNNDPSNCQALCPNCHAKKTRGLLKQ